MANPNLRKIITKATLKLLSSIDMNKMIILNVYKSYDY